MEGKKASSGQLRMIYGLARKAGIDGDTLHLIVDRLCKKDSLAKLTSGNATRVIDYLRRNLGEVDEADGMVTEKQRDYIMGLARRMGWASNPERLRSFLGKQMNVSDVRFLTQKQASVVIEALKAIQQGGRAERGASG